MVGSHTKNQQFLPLQSRARASRSFGLYVVEVENPRSEFRLEIEILLCKSTLGNTKIASEFELDTN